MASLVRGQLAKRLAPFCKDMTSDNFSLSFFRGKGGVTNLELKEDVLMEKLQFPPWLVLRKAACSSVRLKIPWTKLTSKPVKVIIGRLELVVEISPDLVDSEQDAAGDCGSEKDKDKQQGKDKDATDGPAAVGLGGKYGFIDALIDGISVDIDTVTTTVIVPGHDVTLTLNGLTIKSKTPTWTEPSNLKGMRVVDKHQDTVVLFKELVIRSLALSIATHASQQGSQRCPPLVVELDNPHVRVITKKRNSNSSVLVGLELQVLLEALVLPATLLQLLMLESLTNAVFHIMTVCGLAPAARLTEEESAAQGSVATGQTLDAAASEADAAADALKGKAHKKKKDKKRTLLRRKAPKKKKAQVFDKPAAASDGAAAVPATPPPITIHTRVNHFALSLCEQDGSRVAVLNLDRIVVHHASDTEPGDPLFLDKNDPRPGVVDFVTAREEWCRRLVDYRWAASVRPGAGQVWQKTTVVLVDDIVLRACAGPDDATLWPLLASRDACSRDDPGSAKEEHPTPLLMLGVAEFAPQRPDVPDQHVPASQLFVRVQPVQVMFHPGPACNLLRFADPFLPLSDHTLDKMAREARLDFAALGFKQPPPPLLHVDILSTKIVLPALPDDKASVTVEVNIGRASLTNSARCSAFAAQACNLEPFYRSPLLTHPDRFPAKAGGDPDALPPFQSLYSSYSDCLELPALLVVRVEQLSMTARVSRGQRKPSEILSPADVTLWVRTPPYPADAPSTVADTYVLIQVDDPLCLSLQQWQVAFFGGFLVHLHPFLQLVYEPPPIASRVILAVVPAVRVTVLEPTGTASLVDLSLDDVSVVNSSYNATMTTRVTVADVAMLPFDTGPDTTPNDPAQYEWLYQDASGQMRGPFSAGQMTAWLASGFFETDLAVKRPCDPAFVSLSSIMAKSPQHHRAPFSTPLDPPPRRASAQAARREPTDSIGPTAAASQGRALNDAPPRVGMGLTWDLPSRKEFAAFWKAQRTRFEHARQRQHLQATKQGTTRRDRPVSVILPPSGLSRHTARSNLQQAASTSLLESEAEYAGEDNETACELDMEMGVEDFASIGTIGSVMPSWVQAEKLCFWDEEPCTHPDVQVSSIAAMAGFAASLPPPPAEVPQDTAVPYVALPPTRQPRLRVEACDLTIDATTNVFEKLGVVFGGSPGGPPNCSLPPAIPTVDVLVHNVCLSIQDSAVLNMIRLFQPEHWQAVQGEGTTLVTVAEVTVHIDEHGVVVGPTGGTARGQSLPLDKQTEQPVKRLEAELQQLRRDMADAQRALAFAETALAEKEVQQQQLLRSFKSLVTTPTLRPDGSET
eukprot:m.84467 g.84467  ORF g.84467 m.84467 type:complete len:1310 (-) comp14807_c0_seq1:195-4124(-)